MSDSNLYAVFGHPIAHSRSPRIHSLFARQTGQLGMQYEAWDVPADRFRLRIGEFIAQGGNGLNCTIPLKELAFEIASETSARAQQCKAVNTLVVREDASLYGDNTDGIGLIRDLQDNLKIALNGIEILVLGAGGASRGILGPLLECGPSGIFVANRTTAKARDLVAEFPDSSNLFAGGLEDLSGKNFDLILNATAASLTGDLPDLPDDLLNPGGVCYDLAYSMLPTSFVNWGLQHKASISVDGIGMLVEQAAESFRLWRGVLPDTASVIRTLREERSA